MKRQLIIDHISQWLNEYLEKSTLSAFIIGVSGGIDSAITSTLAARTGKKTIVVEMPIHQKEDQVTRAQDHIKWLTTKFPNVIPVRIDLTPSFDAFVSTVQPEKDYTHNLALANTRARLRMSTLYYLATLHHGIVVGTGNKVEDFGVGFYTKYGDGGVDVSPIADLMKTEIYQIAEELQIIDAIQKAQPTDGLWEVDRTDEQQLGASYPELEWAMRYIETNSAEELNERQVEVLAKYKKLHQAALHKINPIPVCLIPKEYFG